MQSVKPSLVSVNMACFELEIDASGAPNSKQLSHSRSTSAGSSRSQGQSSVDLQSSLYPTDALGLPEYDYPTPWSIEEGAQTLGDKYPSALFVKNTFLGTDVKRPSSLQEFLEERVTKSCPVSNIGLPPGLEDLVEPEEAAARLAAVETTFLRKAEMTESSYISSGLSDDPQFWESTCSFAEPQKQCQPVVLDLMQALSAPLQEQNMQPEHVLQAHYQCAPAAFSTYPIQREELVIGSPECPTVGSQGHHVGMCKPCAFLYTKGCSNGADCSFCHLCAPGEKKRRAKLNRSARQMQPQR